MFPVKMSLQMLKMWQNMLLLYFVTILLNEKLASEAMTSSSCPPSCECDVSRKYITCFEDIITQMPFLFPNDTRQLEIREQYLPVLNASMFANLAHLRKLLLSASDIEEIDNDFTKLQKLKRLDLSDNKLCDSVFNTIGQMKQLKELILDDNLLTLAGNNMFKSLENVELLSLSGNQIEVVPPLRGLEELQKLYLSNNFIQTINRSTFHNLYLLEELYLQGNLITQIEPGWANNLHVLRHLDLSENILGSQPSRNVIGLQKNSLLETLSLSHNSLLQIPCHDISRTKHLIKLNLTYNFLSNLENGCLNKLTNLEILDLTHNKIENIENKALQSMPTLDYLLLQENILKNLPAYWLKGSWVYLLNLTRNDLLYISNDSFTGVEYLEVLLLSYNRISSFASGAFCDGNINVLMLDFNELQAINKTQIECATNLVALALNNNFIQEIDAAAFDDLHPLELYLHSNQLETISHKLILSKNYTMLTLHSNPWMCDCRIRWMKEYVDLHSLPDSSTTYVLTVIETDVICASPTPMAGRPVALLYSKYSMACSTFPSPLTIRLILGISISIIGIVVSVNIMKLYCRYRKLEKFDREDREGEKTTYSL